jgi:thioredoxin-related protein
VTYQDVHVVDFISQNLIAMRLQANDLPSWARSYTIEYTPTVLIVDEKGKELHRTVGFLPPQEFIPNLMFGIAKTFHEAGSSKKAKAVLQRLLSEYPASKIAPQANDLNRRIAA